GISFIPYIEDSVLGLISQDSGLFLKNGGRPFVRQRLSDPSSLTGLHLSISDLFLGEQSVKYTISKGCHRLFKWAMHAGLFVSTCGGGGGESLVSHLTYPGQRQRIFTKQSPLMASYIQIKVTNMTRYNIIYLLTMAYSYDLCWSLHSPFLRLYVLNIRSFNYFL